MKKRRELYFFLALYYIHTITIYLFVNRPACSIHSHANLNVKACNEPSQSTTWDQFQIHKRMLTISYKIAPLYLNLNGFSRKALHICTHYSLTFTVLTIETSKVRQVKRKPNDDKNNNPIEFIERESLSNTIKTR